MIFGIHYDQGREMNSYSQIYEKILNLNRISSIRMHIDEPGFWDDLMKITYFIFRFGHDHSSCQLARAILPIIENERKIQVYPNQKTCWHYDNKIMQYYLLKTAGFPVVESWIFWNRQDAETWLVQSHFPLVFKLSCGAGSSTVFLIKNKETAFDLINVLFGKGIKPSRIDAGYIKRQKKLVLDLLKKIGLFSHIHDEFWQLQKDYVFFQKFLPDNKYDTRVTVIGGRAFAFRRMNRMNDFRASGSGLIDHDISKIDPIFISKALEISKKMEFQSMAYDFLYDESQQPKICEISYTYNDTAVYQCPGYFDERLNWHAGHFWPQYFQLADILKTSNLQQP